MIWLLLLISPLQEAHDAYLRGESAETIVEAEAAFNEALTHYLSLPGESPHLAFDLGNTYFHLGEPAAALYHYSRAQQLAPRDHQIRTHLRFASKRLGIAPHKSWQFLSPAEHNILIVVLGALATLMLFFRIRFAWLPASLTILLSATLIYLHVLADPQAILLKSSMLRSESGASLREDPLPAGTRLRLRNERDEWVKVILPSGEKGFVLADSLGIL